MLSSNKIRNSHDLFVSIKHQNGHLITIYYGTNAQWSKKRAESTFGSSDSQNTRDRLIQATKQLFVDENFLWQANKSMPDNPFGSNGQRLPNKPHGLNAYSEIHDIEFCLPSIPRPITSDFWRREGFPAAMFDAPSTSRRLISQ